jgi:hypothetical protein
MVLFPEEYGRLFVFMTKKKSATEPTRFGGRWKKNAHEGADPIPGMNLVGINIANATVTSSALACAEFPVCSIIMLFMVSFESFVLSQDCPWNIQYLS